MAYSEKRDKNGFLQDTEERVTRHSSEKDGITKTLTVTEVENGYIVKITEEGYKASDGKSTKNMGDWYHAVQSYISSSDPLSGNSKKSQDVSGIISDALNNLKL